MLKNFLKKVKNGFTLVELILVIAIIALITSIVITYLLRTQKSSKDIRVIEDMDLFRKKANLNFQMNGNFDNVCCGVAPCDEDVKKICDDADNLNSSYSGIAVFASVSPAQNYCAKIQLNAGDWYCVDSTLESKRYSGDPDCGIGDYTCKTD
jgi:prepilin-type N-terminal cleavage/methylation domain-containing protein